MATAMPTNVPKIEKDKFKLVKKIGSGGFGAVFQMTWKSPQGDIQVAVKRLNEPDPNELNILASLDHASIVKLLGFVDEEMDFWLILELCEGGSLRSYLDEHGGLSTNLQLFVHWAEQATIPIKYLRGKQILHKDLKSPNYLITCDKKLKLADFGLAKKIEHTISNATERASYSWMAPELFTLGKLSPNYDIFALAVVIWELWTGQIPFKGLDFQVVAWKVCQLKERLPIPADMPQPIADLLRQCWDENWHKRPSIEHIISVIAALLPLATAVPVHIWQQQVLTGPWVLEKRFGSDGPGEIQQYANDVTVNPNGDIAIIDSSTKVKVFSIEGVYKCSMDTTQGLQPGQWSQPHQITTSSDGSTYFVTNNTNCVLMYSADCKFKGQWESACPQGSSITPCLCGLAIDAKDYVYVGDMKSRYIYKHKQDGPFVTSVKVDIQPCYISVTSQDTIIVGEYAQYYAKPPQIVSNTGQVLHTLKHPTDELHVQWACFGIHCYRDTLFITNMTNQKKSWTHEILFYSLSGQYLGCIPIHDARPRCLAMTANGSKLIVGGDCDGNCSIYALQK
ncbi:uncharacterized protein [Amphiura filiformis]|uniref:uncharacterized protein n=1 Tax=Amphiura filiformis TaxID=82378 RepID=UPI003B225515